MTPPGETSPVRAQEQHRLSLIRGAACYAEFALLAGTWTTTGIEAKLDGKGLVTGNATLGEGTRKYARYLKGSVPRDKTISAISARYPATALRFWAIHPIGQLLIDNDLSVDAVLRLLELLPAGTARQLVWDESRVATPFRREVPDGDDVIGALADLRTKDGFLALLGRQRLRRLMGQIEYDDLYEFALMDCFAEVVGGCPHLCLAKQILVPTFSDYLEGPCGGKPSRHWSTQHWHDVAYQIEKAQKEAELRGLSMPPKIYVDGLQWSSR